MQLTSRFLAPLCILALMAGSASAASYTVKSGDTLYRIAANHGVSVRAIVQANAISNPNLISIGQVLEIPGRTNTRPAEPRPTTPAPRPRPTTPAPTTPRPTTTNTDARPVSYTRTRTRRVGNAKIGAELIRKTSSRTTSTTTSFETETSATLMGLNRRFRVFRLQRGVEGTTGPNPRVRRSFAVEVLGQNRITIGKKYTRSFYVRALQFPIPVGPVVLDLKIEVGSTADLYASFPFAWNGRTYDMTVGGGAGIGAKAILDRSIVIANAGVEARLDLVNASLPATTKLRRDGVDFDVYLVLSSQVRVSLFAEVGISRFKKRFNVSVPFMRWSFARRQYKVATGNIRLGS